MLECKILTTETELESLGQAWHDLYVRAATRPFSDYSTVSLWWKNFPHRKQSMLHIVTGWRDGRLVALLPLIVYRKRGVRGLLWAGYDSFLGDLQLLENPEDLGDLWRVVHKSPHYDVAEIRYVEQDSLLQEVVSAFPCAKILEDTVITSLRFNGMDSKAWVATLRRKLRVEVRRKKRVIEREGAFSFDVYQDKIPDALLTRMIEEKKAWCNVRGFKEAAFDFVPDLAQDATTHGRMIFFALSCGGKPIGLSLGFTLNKTVFAYMISYDPAWFKCSPGIVTSVEAISWAADNGFLEFNFMEGKESYKLKYMNRQQPVFTYVFCRTFVGWLARFVLLFRRNNRAITLIKRLLRR